VKAVVMCFGRGRTGEARRGGRRVEVKTMPPRAVVGGEEGLAAESETGGEEEEEEAVGMSAVSPVSRVTSL
jgi:hypothetical protein